VTLLTHLFWSWIMDEEEVYLWNSQAAWQFQPVVLFPAVIRRVDVGFKL
jgi:hypothetical protein